MKLELLLEQTPPPEKPFIAIVHGTMTDVQLIRAFRGEESAYAWGRRKGGARLNRITIFGPTRTLRYVINEARRWELRSCGQ